MRGSVNYEHILLRMSYGERDIMEGFVKERLETESKSPHPNY